MERRLLDGDRVARDHGGMVVGVALGLVLLVILYVLSMGPVALTIDTLELDKGPARTFYAPVIWLHDHTPLKRPLEWYLALYGVH